MSSIDFPRHGSGRERRPSTIEASEKSREVSSQKRKARVILSSNQTASLHSRSGDHDCFAVDMEKTAVKVSLRFFFSTFRFALAHGWGCETWREKTIANGDQCNCGLLCQAAHAALSPNLQDNRLDIVLKELEKNPIQNIEDSHRVYFENRFSLTAEEQSQLRNDDPKIRKECINIVIQRLRSSERTSTFMNTHIGNSRNATFANPSASNRIDSSLEKKLRSLEDDLAKQCKSSTIRPREALRQLQDEYQKLLTDLKSKLETAQTQLIALEDSYQQLRQEELELISVLASYGLEITPKRPPRNAVLADSKTEPKIIPPKIPFELSAMDSEQKEKLTDKIRVCRKKAESYQTAMTAFLSSDIAKSSLFKDLKRSLQLNQSPILLDQIFNPLLPDEEVLSLFLIRAASLNLTDNLSIGFESRKTEIKCRLDEVAAQSFFVFKDFESLYKLAKKGLYSREILSSKETPSQQDIDNQFLSFIRKLTPSRSDLQASKRRRIETSLPDGEASSSSKSEGKEEEGSFPKSPSLFASREDPSFNDLDLLPHLEDSFFSETTENPFDFS